MRRALRTALVAALAFLVCASAQALADGGDSLAQMATQLNELETGVARGDAAASTKTQPLLESMATAIRTADAKSWSSTANRMALVAYLLGGGAPGVAAIAVSSGKFPASDSQLIKGVLAYVLGRRKEAIQLLTPIDARTLDPLVAGDVAFAQSVLATPKNDDRAVLLLETARLLAPGGLIEESSLRQEIVLAAQSKNTQLFAHCLRQYMIRFPHSLYAPAFIAALPDIIIDNNLVQSKPSLPLLRLGLSSMDPEQANLILIKVGRDMLISGNIVVANWTSSFVLRQVSLTPRQKALAQMIQGLSRAMSQLNESGIKELDAVDVVALPDADRTLLAAAKEAAARVMQTPYKVAPGSVDRFEKDQLPALDDGVSELVKTALSNVNSFLKSADHP